MRWFLVLGCACVLSSESVAQVPSRWTLSAGPEWTTTITNGRFYGGRLRAEYDLITPTMPFRLRLEAGTFWSPTQSYYARYFDGSSVFGFDQTVDLTFGLSAAVAPLPRAFFSPYVMLGVYARQSWSHRAMTFMSPDGSLAPWNIPENVTIGS